MQNDSLGDRMKGYEAVETNRRFTPLLPIYARIDGRSFSKFTKGFSRPFDRKMSRCMIETTKYLVDKTGATVGYTQSDEISLVWLNNDPEKQMMFDGKVFKLTSVLAGIATVKFNAWASEFWPEHVRKTLPVFDARVFQVPDEVEAMNALYWRVLDARKNAISMAARAHFSHTALQGKNGPEMIEMMKSKNVIFADYPQFFREGTFVKRIMEVRLATPAEKMQIAMLGGDMPDVVRRNVVTEMQWPEFTTIANRAEVLFYHAEPVLKDANRPTGI